MKTNLSARLRVGYASGGMATGSFGTVPGLLLLQKFAPIGGREPALDQLDAVVTRPVTRTRLLLTSAAIAAAGFAIALGVSALLAALKAARTNPALGVDVPGALAKILAPVQVSDWVRVAAFGVVGLVSGLAAAAFLVARHGVRREGASARD